MNIKYNGAVNSTKFYFIHPGCVFVDANDGDVYIKTRDALDNKGNVLFNAVDPIFGYHKKFTEDDEIIQVEAELSIR